jgi:hypothetical protein
MASQWMSLIKHYAMKVYGVVDVFLTLALTRR